MPIIPLGGQFAGIKTRNGKVLFRNGKPTRCCCNTCGECAASCTGTTVDFLYSRAHPFGGQDLFRVQGDSLYIRDTGSCTEPDYHDCVGSEELTACEATTITITALTANHTEPDNPRLLPSVNGEWSSWTNGDYLSTQTGHRTVTMALEAGDCLRVFQVADTDYNFFGATTGFTPGAILPGSPDSDAYPYLGEEYTQDLPAEATLEPVWCRCGSKRLFDQSYPDYLLMHVNDIACWVVMQKDAAASPDTRYVSIAPAAFADRFSVETSTDPCGVPTGVWTLYDLTLETETVVNQSYGYPYDYAGAGAYLTPIPSAISLSIPYDSMYCTVAPVVGQTLTRSWAADGRPKYDGGSGRFTLRLDPDDDGTCWWTLTDTTSGTKWHNGAAPELQICRMDGIMDVGVPKDYYGYSYTDTYPGTCVFPASTECCSQPAHIV